MQRFGAIFYELWLVRLAGILEALLLARIVARIGAARPDNPSIALLYNLTTPIIAPLSFLDSAQPMFGASLEFSTLCLAICVPLLTGMIWLLLSRRATDPIPSSS
ncbi:MAG: YggT family protein [Oscillochloris sp.]|nr:YggT family protein [Oscillochloris sp.]